MMKKEYRIQKSVDRRKEKGRIQKTEYRR